MGQSDSFRAFGFILNRRYCAVSSAFHAVDRHLLPSIAKNGRSIATDLARLPENSLHKDQISDNILRRF